jgi:AraC family transcriptional regulator
MSEAWTERLLRVLMHIETHLDDELSPAQLADIADFSPHHFHRVFRGMVGESVMAYTRRLRLERAAFRLKHGQSEVLPLALLAGYDSHEAFTRAFKAHFGVTPSQFRDQSIVQSEVPAVALRQEPRRLAVAFRRVGRYLDAPEAWAKLQQWTQRNAPVPASIPFALVHDDPDICPETKCRYDACWPVSQIPPALEHGLSLVEVPAGVYAVATHQGPYALMYQSYVNLLGRALPRLQVELAPEPVIEVYLNDPRHTPPEQLATEICVRCQP